MLKYITVALIVSLVKQSTCACPNTFKSAIAKGDYDGVRNSYLYQRCIHGDHIERFILLTNTEKILAGTFVNLQLLKEIGFNDADVHVIESGFAENTPQLKIFKAERNQLQTIENNVFNTLPLELIDLNSNRISHIAEGAFHYMTLNYLCLSDNKLSRINSTWFHDTKIVAFALTHNQITSLHRDSFSGILEMVTLKLDFNKIHQIDYNTFSEQCCLVKLYLSGNSLFSLGFQIRNKLVYVDISFNFISSISLENTTSLGSVSIYPNPWACKCLLRFWKEIDKRGIEILKSYSLKTPLRVEDPLCIVADYITCGAGNVIPVNAFYKEYFNLINYNNLGKYVYRRDDDFIDYDSTIIWYKLF